MSKGYTEYALYVWGYNAYLTLGLTYSISSHKIAALVENTICTCQNHNTLQEKCWIWKWLQDTLICLNNKFLRSAIWNNLFETTVSKEFQSAVLLVIRGMEHTHTQSSRAQLSAHRAARGFVLRLWFCHSLSTPEMHTVKTRADLELYSWFLWYFREQVLP